MNAAKLRRVELHIRKLVEAGMERGVLLRTHSDTVNVGPGKPRELQRGFISGCTACLVGMVTGGPEKHSGFGSRVRAAEALGISFDEVEEIERGFEHNYIDNPLRALGARIRRDYCEVSP